MKAKKRKPRKIKQMLVCPAHKERGDEHGLLYVLCEDGTMWWKNNVDGAVWQREEDVPGEAK